MQVEGEVFELHALGVALRGAEQVVRERQQHLARGEDGSHALGLRGRERLAGDGFEHLRHAEDAVERVAHLVAHRGEEGALSLRRLLRRAPRLRVLFGLRGEHLVGRAQLLGLRVEGVVGAHERAQRRGEHPGGRRLRGLFPHTRRRLPGFLGERRRGFPRRFEGLHAGAQARARRTVSLSSVKKNTKRCRSSSVWA